MLNDDFFMNEALKEAKYALEKGEIPIGAVIVSNNQIIAKAHNMTETLKDVTAHAEILAITSASNNLGSKYLNDCTLYVTIEPCVMCAGALYWSQIGKIVYGANDVKKGFSKINSPILHPKTEITKDILNVQCADLMINFFKDKRD